MGWRLAVGGMKVENGSALCQRPYRGFVGAKSYATYAHGSTVSNLAQKATRCQRVSGVRFRNHSDSRPYRMSYLEDIHGTVYGAGPNSPIALRHDFVLRRSIRA